jgi:hypothetical protein
MLSTLLSLRLFWVRVIDEFENSWKGISPTPINKIQCYMDTKDTGLQTGSKR